jgi:drug/metabolite transporter (DMT)-like permease
MSPAKRKGIYLSLVTALISGVSIFVNKFAVDAIKPPLYFTSAKNLVVGLMIVCLLIAVKKWPAVKKLSLNELKYLLLIAVIGGSVPFYLYFTGLSQIPAVNAAIIHKTLVLWVALLAVPFLRERFSRTQVLAVVLLFAGNLVIGGFNGFQYSQGELLVLLATILWAVENVLAKKILPKVDPDVVSLFRMGFGSVFLVITALVFVPNIGQRSLSLSPMQLFWFSLTALTLFGYVITWYRALKFAPAITVTSVLASSTLVTNVLSAAFITHTFNGNLILQTLLLISGVALFIYAEKHLADRMEVQRV